MKRLASGLFLAAVAALFLAPVAALFSAADPGHAAEVLGAPGFPRVLGVTLGTGAAGAFLSVALGFILARPFAVADWRGKRLQRLVALAPYLIPNFILAMSYVVAWNPGTGLLRGVVPLPFGLYGVLGMTLVFAVAHAPVAFLMLEDKLTRLDPALTEAARLAGANGPVVAWRVELPLLRPSLLGAFALCFALDISAFAIPAWIGAPEHAYPLTYKVYQAIQVGGADGLPEAAVYCLALFALVVPILVFMTLIQRHARRYATGTGKAGRRGDRRPRRLGFGVFQLFFWTYALVTFIAPMTCLVLQTFTPPGCLQSRGLACLADASLRSYRYVLFDLAETRQAFQGSGLWGTLSAIAVLLLGVAALFGLSGRPRLLRGAEAVFTLLMATPGAIIALGLIVAFSGRYGVNLYNTPWIVVLAMVIKHENLAFQPLATGFAGVAGTLVEAARLAGAHRGQVWGRIILPILRPELAGGFFLALIPILGELTMSIFLASPSYRSLGTVLFDLQDYADSASAGALSVLLMVLILLANEAARLVTRGRLGY